MTNFSYDKQTVSWQGRHLCQKLEKAVPGFLINSRFIRLIQHFCYYASVDSHSQLSAYQKKTHSTSRCKHDSHSQLSAYQKETHSSPCCKHVEQCHIWDNNNSAAYRFAYDKRTIEVVWTEYHFSVDLFNQPGDSILGSCRRFSTFC